LTGRCLCGGVRFEVDDPPETLSVCHCASCKKLSGGAGTVNVGVPPSAIRILAGQELLERYRPPAGSAKTFCREAGYPVLIKATAGGHRAVGDVAMAGSTASPVWFFTSRYQVLPAPRGWTLVGGTSVSAPLFAGLAADAAALAGHSLGAMSIAAWAEHHDVTVLTSCATDYLSWKNTYTPGSTVVGPVNVVRFPAERTRNTHDFAELNNIVASGRATRA